MQKNKLAQPLTPKEKLVLEYIEGYIQESGVAPTFSNIKEHFNLASFNSVQKYLKQLQEKNYISVPKGNQKRAIQILNSSQAYRQNLQLFSSPPIATTQQPRSNSPSRAGSPDGNSFTIPLLGRVAAGRPLEAMEHDEHIVAPAHFLKRPDKSFALRVVGQSMIEDGILDGDVILVQKQSIANNGDIVVASVENEATVKRFYLKENKVELRPANSTMTSIWLSPDEVEIQGLVVGLLRKYGESANV
jgi:repressor LexA